MEHRDLIKDQIEQLGKVLARIMAGFLGFKAEGRVSEGIEASNKQLNSELDIDMEKILLLDKQELKAYIKERKLTAGHLEILSDYLIEIGENEIKNNKHKAKINLMKAIELLEISDEISKTMSFMRVTCKEKIESLLKQCS